MNNRGQSMIEYALIAVLVILGVVVMGPYVLRSVNAHFKLWDESVQDSATENIAQAPIDDVPDIPLNCKCPVSKGNCGSTDGGVGGCNANEREYDYNCNPQGCNGAAEDSYCVTDDTCCVDAKGQGCGGTACPTTGCPTDPTTALQNTNGANDCYFGYELVNSTCGSTNSTQCVYCPQSTGCSANSSGCALPSCTGTTPPDPNSTACPNSPGTTANVPLLTKYNVGNHLSSSDKCTFNGGGGYANGTPTACEYICDTANGYTYSNGACSKSCPSTDFTPVIQNKGKQHFCNSGACCGGGYFCDVHFSTAGEPDAEAAFVCKTNGYNYLTGFTSGSPSVTCDNSNGDQCFFRNCTASSNPYGDLSKVIISCTPNLIVYKHSYEAVVITDVTCSNCPKP